MKLYQKIVSGGLVLAGLAGLVYNGLEQKRQERQEVQRLEYFLQRGSIGNVGAEMISEQGVSVALGDMDGDGDLDVITANAYPGEIKYFENIGNGQYPERGSIGNVGGEAAGQGVSIALGDMDGDGDLDVIVATANPGEIKYFENIMPQKK